MNTGSITLRDCCGDYVTSFFTRSQKIRFILNNTVKFCEKYWLETCVVELQVLYAEGLNHNF